MADSTDVDITPNKDGGVLKKIVTAGKDSTRPGLGCKVSVHYVGTLTDGSGFDSSRERNTPFEFSLAKGTVIRGWDIAVATMNTGERAIFTIRGDYAYGESGSPPKIGPNATLIFDIELLRWKAQNLSGQKDNGILRYPMEVGTGNEFPRGIAEVHIKLKGEFEDRVFDDREVNYRLGEEKIHDIPPGVGKALQSFTLGETSVLRLKPQYGFGAAGNAKFNIPPDAALKYTVTLKWFEENGECWLLSNEEKVKKSRKLKELGTTRFKAGHFDLAIKLYSKISEYLAGSADFENELEVERKSLLLAGRLNSAMCHLKLNNFVEAKHCCEAALELDPENVKALYRRGLAYQALMDHQLAKADFESVLRLDPTNKAAVEQIGRCQHGMKQSLAKEKEMYANMFEKFAQKDREWRFGWLEGERPQVDLAETDDTEVVEMRKKRRDQKIQYLETTARLLEEKKLREAEEAAAKEAGPDPDEDGPKQEEVGPDEKGDVSIEPPESDDCCSPST